MTRSARCMRVKRATPRWFPATCATNRRSTASARRSTVAGAGSTYLVGNAGLLGPLSPLHHVDPGEWNDVLAVNVTANWRLLRALDPLLRASSAGRVVLVSSGAGHRSDLRAYWGPYAVSKAALDALARTYAAETLNTSAIRVMLVNPGPLRTRMRAAAMPGEDPASLRTPEELAPEDPAALWGGLERDRQALRLPAGPDSCVPRTRLMRPDPPAPGSALRFCLLRRLSGL